MVALRTSKSVVRLVPLFSSLSFALTTTAPQRAQATVLRSQSIENLARSADLVVRAKVVSAKGTWRGSRIYTRVRVQVRDRWLCRSRGQGSPKLCSSRTVDFWTLGGKVGRIEQRVFGAPRMTPGADMVLFLTRRRGGLFVTGMAQGAFLVARKGNQTWAVRRLGGVRWMGHPPVSRLRLEHLRALVRKAASPGGASR